MAKSALKQISRLPGASKPAVKKSPLHPQVQKAKAVGSALKDISSINKARKVNRTVAPNLPGQGKLGPERDTMISVRRPHPDNRFFLQSSMEPRVANRKSGRKNK